MKTCPYCWEKIQNIAKKCKFCWEWIEKNGSKNAKETKDNKIKIKDNLVKEVGTGQKGRMFNWRTLKSILLCKGRLSRWEFWFYKEILFILWLLFIMILVLIQSCVNSFFNVEDIYFLEPGLIITWIFFILYIIRRIVLLIWRSHDCWKSWRYILLLIVPLVNIFVWCELWFCKSDVWDNKFWSEPDKVKRYINLISIIMYIIASFIIVWASSHH